MFGPNVSSIIESKVNFHHREENFFQIYSDIKSLFNKKFNLNDKYEIIVITGSGSLSIESIISSFKYNFSLQGKSGRFKDRWSKLLTHYKKNNSNSNYQFHVQYETSKSEHNDLSNKTAFFVDSVSSFPYYDIPKNAKIVVTVSSKLLGCSPVLGIVLIDKNILKDHFIDKSVETYLNINKHIYFSSYDQTPFTPAIPLYDELRQKLQSFQIEELKNKVNYVSSILVDCFGEENIIGSSKGPVITLKSDFNFPKEIITKYQPYGSKSIKKSNYQIFTYSEEVSKYEDFVKDYNNFR